MSPEYSNAFEIDKGTISIGGSSDILFKGRTFNESDDSKTFSFYIDGGYFILKNLELGSELSLYYRDSDSEEVKRYMIGPVITSHLPFNDNSNFTLGAGLGYVNSETDEDSGTSYGYEGISIFASLGWEYFFNQNVALNINLKLRQTEWDMDNYSYDDNTETSLGTMFGLKIFFPK